MLAQSTLATKQWKTNPLAASGFEINGTEGRSNPIRKELSKPYSDDELFIRYRIRYAAESIDTPGEDEGEFFVLWLDTAEGGDGSTHSGGVPNIGIHVSDRDNRFMVRFASRQEKFGPALIGDKEFLIVARLWKTHSGKDRPFDQLDLWVDPSADQEHEPDASVSSKASIPAVKWIGFSTGAKTEFEDRIFVWDIELARDWRTILDLPTLQTPGKSPPLPRQRTVEFDQHVYPILKAKCFDCHAGIDADLRLDIHDEVLNFCTIGSASESRLYELVSTGQMPPEGEVELTADEIKTIGTWIDEGLRWNAEKLPAPVPQSDHWAFQPIVRPTIPKVQNRAWVRTAVDAFIASRHESLGLTPAAEADPATLSRRMSLDMLGLPPQDHIQSVDRLLSHPAYGQRWARHWLDVARWAESNGYQHNRARPYAWRYRDWVVDAFNDDMPFNEFLKRQIAGDELEPILDEDGVDANLVATGFLAAARYSGNELDKRIQRNDILVDIVNTTSTAFLGLTMECAQCHSHKFDPITIRDYYRMQAFFAAGQPGNVGFHTNNPELEQLVDERCEIFERTYQRQVKIRRRRGIENPELVIPKTVVAKMSAADKQRFQQLEQSIAKFGQTWSFYAPSTASARRPVLPHDMRWPLPWRIENQTHFETRLLPRGDVNALGPEVEPGWPLVFGQTTKIGLRPRLALANWMASPNNPLTARVWVNRIWQWHFGVGLVETMGDFGTQGTEPSHPELLDYLASELMDHDWSTNHLHRLILESATYRQSTRFSPDNVAIDPENRSLWRFVPRRLEAEAIRDSMLAVSGKLDLAAGGPSDEIDGESNRRGLYLKQHRERFPSQQMLFDGADGVASCSRRRVSTSSLQPLWLLNSDFANRVSAGLADRAGDVSSAIRICFGRDATADEIDLLRQHAAKHGLASACLAILNSSEFLYLP